MINAGNSLLRVTYQRNVLVQSIMDRGIDFLICHIVLLDNLLSPLTWFDPSILIVKNFLLLIFSLFHDVVFDFILVLKLLLVESLEVSWGLALVLA